MLDVNTARRQMIEQQVRAWNVLDLGVLGAMERVPREEFTPAAYRELAFADMNLPLGHGQSMLAPKLELCARTQLASPGRGCCCRLRKWLSGGTVPSGCSKTG